MNRTVRILRESLRTLSRHPVRTAFMMLGTLAGVTALTVLLAMGRGTQREVLERVQRMLSGSTVFVRAGGSQVVGAAHGPPANTLKLDDLAAIENALEGVQYTDPMLLTQGREVVFGNRNVRTQVIGHSAASEIVWNRSVSRGRYMTRDDVTSAARVALLGETLVGELFDGRDPVGEQIRIGSVPFQVIGVLELAGVDPHGIDKDRDIIIPVSTMMRRILNIDYIAGAKIAFAPGTDLDLAVLEITDVLRERHSLGPDELNDFALFTPVQVQERVESTNRTFTLFLPLLAAITIVIGGMVLASLMLLTVNERRAEIGLRRALGARPRDVSLQLLLEAAAITTIGGLVALVLARATLALLAAGGRATTAMPWDVGLLGVLLALLVGILAGLLPARRAARLEPIQTLR